jgi:hypothetical protein
MVGNWSLSRISLDSVLRAVGLIVLGIVAFFAIRAAFENPARAPRPDAPPTFVPWAAMNGDQQNYLRETYFSRIKRLRERLELAWVQFVCRRGVREPQQTQYKICRLYLEDALAKARSNPEQDPREFEERIRFVEKFVR